MGCGKLTYQPDPAGTKNWFHKRFVLTEYRLLLTAQKCLPVFFLTPIAGAFSYPVGDFWGKKRQTNLPKPKEKTGREMLLFRVHNSIWWNHGKKSGQHLTYVNYTVKDCLPSFLLREQVSTWEVVSKNSGAGGIFEGFPFLSKAPFRSLSVVYSVSDNFLSSAWAFLSLALCIYSYLAHNYYFALVQLREDVLALPSKSILKTGILLHLWISKTWLSAWLMAGSQQMFADWIEQ